MINIKSLFTSIQKQDLPSEQGLKLVPDNVVMQEIVTYFKMNDGVKVTKTVRKFRQNTHDESTAEEII